VKVIVIEQFGTGSVVLFLAWTGHLARDSQAGEAFKRPVQTVIEYRKERWWRWTSHGEFHGVTVPDCPD
jgi:hypothetical protein